MLGRRSHANTAASFLIRHIKSPPDIPEVAKDLGLKRDSYNLRDLWEDEDLASKEFVEIALPPHGSAIYRVSEK